MAEQTKNNRNKADKMISLFRDMDTIEQSEIVDRLTKIMLSKSGGTMEITL